MLRHVILQCNHKCDALRDLVSFVQFKKREKHPWRSVTFSKVAGSLLKVTLLHGCFSHFLNCTIGTESCKTSHVVELFFQSELNFELLCGYLALRNYPKNWLLMLSGFKRIN